MADRLTRPLNVEQRHGCMGPHAHQVALAPPQGQRVVIAYIQVYSPPR